MRKGFQILFFVMICFAGFGQGNSDTIHKWSVGLSGALNYTRFDYTKSYFNHEVNNIFVLTPGINLFGKRRISKHFSFEFGVNYYALKNKTIFTDYFETDVSVTSLKLLSFPTTVSYNFGKRRLNFSLTGGLEWTFLAESKEIYQKESYPSTVEVNTYPTGQFSLYTQAGLQINYEINKNIVVFIQAQYSNQLMPYIKVLKVNMGPDNVYEKTVDFMRLPMGIIYKL